MSRHVAGRAVVVVVATVVTASLTAPPATAQERGQPPTPQLPRRDSTDRVSSRKGQHPATDPSSVLVRFKQGTSLGAAADAAQRSRSSLRAAVGETGFAVVATNGSDPDAVAAQLRADPAVDSVEPNYVRTASDVPNDTFFSTDQGYLQTLHLPQAWSATHGSTGIRVAVLDTGVDLGNAEFAGRLRPGWNFVANTNTPQDDEGHGTEVAGVAAANTNNNFGIAGTAWNASIIPVKVLNNQGQGSDANIAAGITWATDQGASIINMSLGGPGFSQVLHDAVSYALAHNVVVVAAAGNTSSTVPQYPAAEPGVLAVAATDANGDAAWFSEHGPWISIAAPGIDIAAPDPFFGGSGFVVDSGTSFSSPIVAGIAVLVRAQHPTWTNTQVVNWLEATATDRGPAGVDETYGHGLVDAWAAVGGPGAASPGPAGKDAFEPNDVPARVTPLAVGQTKNATISPEGDVDWYEVSAPGSGSLTVTVQPPSVSTAELRALEMDPVLSIYSADNRLLQTVDASGPGDGESVTVTDDPAPYHIGVRNFAGSRSPGPYTISAISSQDPAPLFGNYVIYPTGGSAFGVASGDFNSDGRADAAMSTRSYNDPENDMKVFVFLQQADGTLAAPTKLATDLQVRDGGVQLSTGDLNVDGRTDLALATMAGIDIFYQSGGSLQGKTLVPVSATGVVASDVDGDGRDDLVATTPGGITLLSNTTTGFVPSPISTQIPEDLKVADVTGDGRKDVVAVGATTDVDVYAQQPNHSFVLQHYPGIPPVHPSSYCLGVGDATGDGRPDVFVTIAANTPNSFIDIFPQLPDGSLGSAARHISYDFAEPATGADMNLDNRGDIVVLHGHFLKAGVYRGTSAGPVGNEELYPISSDSGNGFSGLAIGDVTGDRRPDILAADMFRGLVVVPSVASSQTPQATTDPEWVRSTSPADFATGVATTGKPTVQFGRALNAATVNSNTVQLIDGVTGTPLPATPSYNAGNQTVTVTPATTLSTNHPYAIHVGALSDGAANVFTDGYTFRFKSAAPPSFGVPVKSFYLRDQNAPGPPDNTIPFGSPDCIAVTGDWDGNGTSTVGAYCGGTWYLRNSNTSGSADIAPFAFGAPGYTPVVGDWDGDGKDSIGVYVNGNWYLRNHDSAGAPEIAPFAYGTTGYTPVVGNWDGVGSDGIGVFVNGSWFLRNSLNAGAPNLSFAYGGAGYRPVVGNWDGLGGDGIGVVIGSGWYLRNDPSAGSPETWTSYGDASYNLVPGDWNGDHITTIGVAT